MMLRRLQLDAFKAYRSLDVALEPFTLIIGPNGSAKTSILQAVDFAASLVQSTIGEVLDDAGWVYRDLVHLRNERKQMGFKFTLDDETAQFVWEIRLGHKRGPGVAAESASVTVYGDEPNAAPLKLMERQWRDMSRLDEHSSTHEQVRQRLMQSWLVSVDDEERERFPSLLKIADWARSVAGYVELQPNQLRTTSRKTSHGVGVYGETLAGFLAFLKDEHPKRFDRVRKRVAQVYPRLSAFELKTVRGGWVRLIVRERWGNSPVRLNTQQVSDGLLRLVAIAAIAESPNPQSLIMFDEIENGLHPHLLEAVVGLLQGVADNGTQVLVTTHSPIALNYVQQPEQVLVAHRDRRTGVGNVVTLADAGTFHELATVMDAGEIWYNIGEQALVDSAVTDG